MIGAKGLASGAKVLATGAKVVDSEVVRAAKTKTVPNNENIGSLAFLQPENNKDIIQ